MDQGKIRQLIEQQQDNDKVFIKWWEADNDNAQIESLDYFLRSLLGSSNVTKFELLDLEQMWQELLQNSHDRLERVWRNKVEIIDWYFRAADGSEKMRSCCFRAEGLLATYEEIVSPARGE